MTNARRPARRLAWRFEPASPMRLRRMLAAGHDVMACYDELAAQGRHLAGELIGRRVFREYDHYPRGNAGDRKSGCKYYYHAHDEGEHGHFHLFMSPAGMPAGVRSLARGRRSYAHLGAIGLDAYGLPVRLFTINRWASEETWYAARDVVRMIDRVDLSRARPPAMASRWLAAVVRLFRRELRQLVGERDRVVAALQARQPLRRALDDRSLEVVTEMRISIDRQLSAVRRALGV